MRWVVPIHPTDRPAVSIAIVPMRRPSVVLVPEYVRRFSFSEPSTGDDDRAGAGIGDVCKSSVDTSFAAALTSAICTTAAATATTPALTTPTPATTPAVHSTTADLHQTYAQASTTATTTEDQHEGEGDEAEIGEYRRKATVLVCSIGLVIAFNFAFILLALVNHFTRQNQVLRGLLWSAMAGLGDSQLTDVDASQSVDHLALFPSDNRSACVFAVFALVCNSYHLGLLFLLHRTKRLYLVAALFLIYIDVGICGACLYFGVVCEFYMWLAAVVAMAYYIFGRHVSRVFLVAVLLEGLLLYPLNMYVIKPVAPLHLDSPMRLAGTCTMIMCVGIISHIHEASRQSTLDRLRESNDKLRRSTESKTLFLSAITHELRTPLTGIIGMADELLLDEEEKEAQSQPGSPDQDDRCHQRVYRHPVQTEEERMEAVRIIVTCARHLLGLVNDVLDFEKIESRQLDLEAIPFDVEKEADLVTSMLAFPAASTRVRIEKQMRLAHRTRVGDPLRFRQVLFNLLSNAIKFTPAEGTVTLSIHDEEEDEDGGNGNESGSDDCENSAGRSKLRVEVRDTGIGISETAMKNLFKHFSQGGTCVSRQYGGSGLGLAICKHLVEAMKGQIGCSSEGKNKGSIFWFTLPLPVSSSTLEATADSTQVASCSLAGSSAPPSPPDQEVPAASAGSTDSRHHHQPRHCFDGMKVLLVEDNLVNQKVGRRLLERIGCDVRVAENGQECIDMLERESFSLIFMDCQMPVLDGYEATRRIREKERAEQRSRTPIVALTASCIKSDRQVCFDSGMDDWMSKPFDQGALCSALLKWARQPHSYAER